MTTRRNFLKTGSISLAGLLVGEKVYSAVSTPAPIIGRGACQDHS